MLTFIIVAVIILSFIALVLWELRHAAKVDDNDMDF